MRDRVRNPILNVGRPFLCVAEQTRVFTCAVGTDIGSDWLIRRLLSLGSVTGGRHSNASTPTGRATGSAAAATVADHRARPHEASGRVVRTNPRTHR